MAPVWHVRGAVKSVGLEADAVFVGGNGLRAIGAIDALERALSRPVLTANQVVLWAALRAAKAGLEVRNYGRIFETK